VLTKADALAALDLIEEELEITANLEEPFTSLIKSLRATSRARSHER
jgi:hypothetical protein